MQKVFTEFQYMINEREMRIQCDPNLPINHAKEAAFCFLKDLGLIEDQVKANQEEVQQEEVVQEELITV